MLHFAASEAASGFSAGKAGFGLCTENYQAGGLKRPPVVGVTGVHVRRALLVQRFSIFSLRFFRQVFRLIPPKTVRNACPAAQTRLRRLSLIRNVAN